MRNIFIFYLFIWLNSFQCQLIRQCDPSIIYSPLNESSPSYSVSHGNLSDSLRCYPGVEYRQRWILLIPGSTEEVNELYNWNWMTFLNQNNWSYCTLNLPEKALVDLQIAGEYVVYSIRTIFQKAMKEKEKGLRRNVKINLIGHSLGGTLPRFALRFWPDTRSKVKNLISFGVTNHGTILVNIICQILRCPIGIIQQRRRDIALEIYDYCAFRLTLNVLRGQLLKRITHEKCCSHMIMLGINRTAISFIFRLLYSAEEHARRLIQHFGQFHDEPQLKCSFRFDCLQRKENLSQINRQYEKK